MHKPKAQLTALHRDSFLDGWRAVAALAVVLVHATHYRLQLHPSHPLDNIRDGDFGMLTYGTLARLSVTLGQAGVPIFFMISGYIITTLLLREERENGRISLPAFYVRRTFRIFPAMFACIAAVSFMSQMGWIGTSTTSFLGASTFTCNIVQCDWWLAHFWSLAFEEQFYLVWPALFMLIQPRRTTILLPMTAILYALAWFIPYLSALAYLALGAAYAHLNTARSFRVPPILAGFALAFLLVSSQLPLRYAPVLAYLQLVSLPLIFFGSFESSWFRWFLDRRPLAAIGRASYGVYLWQQLFLAAPTEFKIAPTGAELVLLPVIVWLSYRFLELPLMRLGRKISDHLKVQPSRSLYASGPSAPRHYLPT